MSTKAREKAGDMWRWEYWLARATRQTFGVTRCESLVHGSAQRTHGRSGTPDGFHDRESGGRLVTQEGAHFAVVVMHH